MPDLVEIDGGEGEGGGQVLRTALGLSLATGTPVRLVNVRANRSPPGLRAQHVAAVRAAAAVGGVEVDVEVGARRVELTPAKVVTGEHRFAVGTAGSATLVLQTVLPALLRADAPSSLVLEGGTHNPLAPPFEFLERVYAPLVRRLGAGLELSLVRPGFYPAGGGELRVEVRPGPLSPFDLLVRGPVVRRRALALVSNLPRTIADRELAVVARRLRWKPDELEAREDERARGPGNALLLDVECEHAREVVSAVGERAVRAEDVARSAIDELERWLGADVPVGEHLADQLLLLLALAGGGSFRTLPLSSHTTTQIDGVRRFLPVAVDVEKHRDGTTTVRVRGR